MSYGGAGFVSSMGTGRFGSNYAPLKQSVNPSQFGEQIYQDGKWIKGPNAVPQWSAAQIAEQAKIDEANKPVDWAALLGKTNANSGGRNVNINTSIGARPIATDNQVNAALSKYGSMKPRITGPLANTASQLYGQEAQAARVNAGRDMTAANANHLLQGQIARSGAGLNWGQLGQRSVASADNQALRDQSTALALLRSLGVL